MQTRKLLLPLVAPLDSDPSISGKVRRSLQCIRCGVLSIRLLKIRTGSENDRLYLHNAIFSLPIVWVQEGDDQVLNSWVSDGDDDQHIRFQIAREDRMFMRTPHLPALPLRST